MHLSRFPRLNFCHSPTPLEPMESLTRVLGGPTLYVKRDDCTGLATGGNKTRKLEFLIADAVQQGAEVVVTHGAVQSNHVRQTAAAARKVGLRCEALLERRVQDPGPDYDRSGNLFLDKLFDAKIDYRPTGGDMNVEAKKHADQLTASGKKAYFIPGGGSNKIGALGYVNCAIEMLQQANDMRLRIDYVVHATGSSGTQAGLVAGLEGANSGIKVYGVGVRQPKAKQEEMVYNLASETADMLGVRGGIPRESVVANSDYVGPGYGVSTPEMVDAIKLTARTEGILLDPVYSGKGMAGLIDLCRKKFFSPSDNVVFLHTGGSVGLFAYQELFASNE